METCENYLQIHFPIVSTKYRILTFIYTLYIRERLSTSYMKMFERDTISSFQNDDKC